MTDSKNSTMKTETRLLQFPEIEPWPESINGELLLNEILTIINRFVVLPKWAGETLALWVLHTYAYQLRDVTTYLGIESPEKRCGKTTLLTVLSELVNRPIISSNISSPAFFRVIEETRPTLLIDEADTFLQANDELRGILDYADEITGARPNLPSSLNDRAADIWEPLLVLADLAGGHWPETIRQAAVSLTEAAQETNPIGSLLFDIFVTFVLYQSDRLFSRTIITELNDLPDRPWKPTNKSRVIDEAWLSRQLRPYGVQPRNLRINHVQAKGYLREDFRETFRRYIPKSEMEELHAEAELAVSPAPNS
jgi:hypothetical protein